MRIEATPVRSGKNDSWTNATGVVSNGKAVATIRCPNASNGVTHKIAKMPARVEHVFGAMEQMGGKKEGIRTIGQARADFALTMMAVTYYSIKRLAFLDAEDPILGW